MIRDTLIAWRQNIKVANMGDKLVRSLLKQFEEER